MLAITLHNIPEGLAVGVAFGALAFNQDPALLAGAVALDLDLLAFLESLVDSVIVRLVN